ncbi:neural proliferation differentiation and control protein-1 npdc-1 protein [Holotrichia oblita]|uniref:Neural proliferation differentiation and control protein-1 npdc-1 protein n=1 Tax=Holotrichia oblita TaxID=644536 RepID=A0ACB9TSA6_HOLOL|nr:neural proliferation differentiation and control protein-1 npdc-1 protein [Holotrichia oblita]
MWFFYFSLQKHVKNASDVDYPAYGITGPSKEISPSGDRRLAQSAQMYHYQHQKQQIIAMDSGNDNLRYRAVDTERHGSVSEADSDEENEGDYTVYEYAGLAPIGEMEVRNPLFQDDPTPAQTPAVKSTEDLQKK